jgi:putative PIN family toxin of toxin-antitoxin system
VLVALDTNVFISALISNGGYCDRLLGLWQDKNFDLLTSDFQRDELSRVLAYEKLKPYVAEHEILRLNQWLNDFAVIVEPKLGVTASDDPDDNIILGAAIAGQADILVSGDKKHLLRLGAVDNIPILSSREAVERILSASTG